MESKKTKEFLTPSIGTFTDLSLIGWRFYAIIIPVAFLGAIRDLKTKL